MEITTKQLKDFIDSGSSLMLLDVRDYPEWVDGVIENSFLCSLQDLKLFIKQTQELKTMNIVCICASGIRSLNALNILKKNGYINAYTLTGGINSWKSAGLPLTPHLESQKYVK